MAVRWLPLTLLVLACCGCGQSDSSSRPIPTPRSDRTFSVVKPRYLHRANAICAKYRVKLKEIGQPSGNLATQAATAHRINVESMREFAEVRHLAQPRADRALLTAMFRDVQRALEFTDASTRAISKDSAKATKAAVRGLRLLDDVNRRLAAYGLTTCAQ